MLSKKAKKKWMRMDAAVSGEMQAASIPPAPGVDVDAIKAGDDDPLDVVVEIPAGESTRGWDYRPESLKDIVDHVNKQTLSGFLGHQRPDEVSNRFEAPVTHWIGAKMEGETAYFRGIIDAAAQDLKRWIRTKRIKQVSIFGFPQLQTGANGEIKVVGYQPLSIDWTPLDRSGMPTRIVAMGEMDDRDEGGPTMDWKELLAQLEARIAEGKITLDEVVAALDPEGNKKAADAAALITDVKEKLGVTDDGQVAAAVEEAVKALKTSKKADGADQASEVVKEKVAGEMAQALVMKMLASQEGKTREIIAGEVDSLLADKMVKEMISRLHTDSPAVTGSSSGNGTAARTKRASI